MTERDWSDDTVLNWRPWAVGVVALVIGVLWAAMFQHLGPALFLGSIAALGTLHRRPSISPLVVWWLLGLAGILIASREVDGYIEYVLHETFPRAIDWPYVRLLSALQAGVVAVLALVLRPWSRSARPLAGFALMLIAAGYFGLGLMHAAPEFSFFWEWVIAGVVGCAVLAIRAARRTGGESLG